MGLRPFVISVAAVAALAVPLLASPKISASQTSSGAEPPAHGLPTGPEPRVPTTVTFPLATTLTTRAPPPPVAGPTTTTVPKFSGFLAQSADFVTADVGFALGYVHCGKEICFALRRTLDRGASWIALPTPPFNVGAPGDRAPFELHFANTLDGWAFGATVWATDRRGQELASGQPRRPRHRHDVGGGGSLRSRPTVPSVIGHVQFHRPALAQLGGDGQVG